MKIAVVIPSFRVTKHVLGVIAAIPESVSRVYVVDDACPDKSGEFVATHCTDPRVKVLYNPTNLGVGGAVVRGYKEALNDGMDIVIKIDGDGQMDPALIPRFVAPIASGRADYTKGTRFFSMRSAKEMPWVRLIGNAGLTFVSKAASGYWSVMDPTNGFTAIHSHVLRLIPLDAIEKRYFFESDMLFHLGLVRAVVHDVPMFAHYGDEVSHLKISHVLLTFPAKYAARFIRRFVYNYLLRDFNAGSLATLVGLPLLLFGIVHGLFHWIGGAQRGTLNPIGTVMISALSVTLGVQLLIAAALFDIQNQPSSVLHD